MARNTIDLGPPVGEGSQGMERLTADGLSATRGDSRRCAALTTPGHVTAHFAGYLDSVIPSIRCCSSAFFSPDLAVMGTKDPPRSCTDKTTHLVPPAA